MPYVAAFAATMIFALLTRIAPPTIIFGDGGEMVAAAVSLGIGHPPGYPLYVLAGKVFSLLPVGDAAFRLNLMAVTLTVLLGAVVYMALSGAGKKLPAAAVAALFIMSPMVIYEGTHEKGAVYIMANLAAMAALYAGLVSSSGGGLKWKYLSFYIAGFLPVLHQSASLISVTVVAMPLFLGGKDRLKGLLPALALYCLALFTPWLCLFIRAQAGPAMDWAGVNSAAGVLNHINRSVYNLQPDNIALTAGSLLRKTADYFVQYGSNYPVFLLLLPAGIYAAVKNRSAQGIYLLCAAAINLLLTAAMTGNSPSPVIRFVNSGFYILTDLILLFACTEGLAFLLGLAGKKWMPACAGALAVAVAATSAANLGRNDRSSYFQCYDHGANILRTAGPGSAVFSAADSTAFSLHYLKQVKKLFPDVRAYDTNLNVLDLSLWKGIRNNGGFSRADEREAEKRLAEAMPGRIYYMDLAAFPEMNLATQPWGNLQRLLPQGAIYPGSVMMCRVWAARGLYGRQPDDIFHRENRAFYLIRLAEYAALSGNRPAFDVFRQMAVKTGGDIPTVYKNIAYIYFSVYHDGRLCVDNLEKAAELEPNYVPVIKLLIELYRSGGFNDKADYWQKRLEKLNFRHIAG